MKNLDSINNKTISKNKNLISSNNSNNEKTLYNLTPSMITKITPVKNNEKFSQISTDIISKKKNNQFLKDKNVSPFNLTPLKLNENLEYYSKTHNNFYTIEQPNYNINNFNERNIDKSYNCLNTENIDIDCSELIENKIDFQQENDYDSNQSQIYETNYILDNINYDERNRLNTISNQIKNEKFNYNIDKKEKKSFSNRVSLEKDKLNKIILSKNCKNIDKKNNLSNRRILNFSSRDKFMNDFFQSEKPKSVAKNNIQKGGIINLQTKRKTNEKFNIKNIQIKKTGYCIMKNSKYTKEAAQIIQEWWRRLIERYKERKMIIKIQSFWRGRLIRKNMNLFNSFLSMIEKVLVNHIRCWVFYFSHEINKKIILKKLFLKYRKRQLIKDKIKLYLYKWINYIRLVKLKILKIKKMRKLFENRSRLKEKKCLLKLVFEKWRLKVKINNIENNVILPFFENYLNISLIKKFEKTIQLIKKFGLKKIIPRLLDYLIKKARNDKLKKLIKNKHDLKILKKYFNKWYEMINYRTKDIKKKLSIYLLYNIFKRIKKTLIRMLFKKLIKKNEVIDKRIIQEKIYKKKNIPKEINIDLLNDKNKVKKSTHKNFLNIIDDKLLEENKFNDCFKNISNVNIWEKYEKKNKIGYGIYSSVYKVQHIETKEFYAIKEIEKGKFENLENLLLNELETINKIKTENCLSINEVINTKKYIYIIMDLCECNLEDYIKRRKKPISINEIRQVLIQLNNIFQVMLNKENIYIDLKPKNILLSLDRLDKCLIKLSHFCSNKYINPSNSFSFNENLLTMAPEVLNDEKELINSKSVIWSLGTIIYYMLFKEYPYTGQIEYQILNDIQSNKELKYCDNEKLNDLLNKMLKININERISWKDYFNHPFFNQNNLELFNFNCEKHLKIIKYYCIGCKKNICENCLKEHLSHKIIPFYKIGLSEKEINRMENIFKEIENKLNSFNKMKKDIEYLLTKMKLIKENRLIYKNDKDNNYKEYYIKYLENMNKKLENNEIKLIDLTPNEIICIYDIKKNEEEEEFEEEEDIEEEKKYDFLDKPINILNCYEEIKRDKSISKLKEAKNNENEIKENCVIYLNNKKIDFCYKYKFLKEGKYSMTITFTKPLTNLNCIFMNCNKLLSIDLSKFNTYNIINMSYMFSHCSFLVSLDLSNINTNNVTNMSNMFSHCCSLKSLNLSNFNTINVTNMSNMFIKCSSLISLNLTNFNTKNVTNMSNMFSHCCSLSCLDLSNFDTNNVINMRYMFSYCSILTSLDLSNFNTNNVTNMSNMFSHCCSLKSLNLSNFNTINVANMSNMFSGLKKDCKIVSNDKNIQTF